MLLTEISISRRLWKFKKCFFLFNKEHLKTWTVEIPTSIYKNPFSVSLERILIRVSWIFPQAKVPWHCTRGSPQWSCSHSVHCFPPKPWWQWHWPVNCSRQAEKITNPPKNLFRRSVLALNITMQVLPCCSCFPWSDLGYSHRGHTLSPDRSSSGSEHTGHSCGLQRSPYKDRLLSAHHSGNVHRYTLTG